MAELNPLIPPFGGMTTNEKLDLIKQGKMAKEQLTPDDYAHIIAAMTDVASQPIAQVGTIVADPSTLVPGAGGWKPTAAQLAGIATGVGVGMTVGGVLLGIPGPTQIAGAIVMGVAALVGAFFGVSSAGPRTLPVPVTTAPVTAPTEVK